MKLREIAHSRAGDKGNISNVSVIARKPEYYDFIKQHVTAGAVKKLYGDLVKGEVVRYELPKVQALNFVMQDALGGGVTRTLSLDIHGKSFSSIMMGMEVPELS